MWRMTFTLLLYYLLHTPPAVCNEPWSELPEITGELCPNTCIWKKNITQISPRGYCCKECSCQADCGHECCFPERDEHNLQRRQVYSCTAPVIGTASNEESAFYMIDKNPPDGCLVAVDGMDSNAQCGDHTVAYWGSLYPVVSKSTKTIYRNEICAKCHNDTKYVKWDARQACSRPVNDYQYIFNVVDVDVALEHYSEYCRLIFGVKGFTNVLKNKQCIRDVVDECQNPLSFVLLEGVNSSRADIAKACVSGFYSPVETFANVYCWMCSVKDDDMARPTCSHNSRFNLDSNFNMLIDTKKVQQMNTRTSATMPIPKACKRTKNKNEQDCVTILCPIGQMRIVNRCDFPTKEWRHALYSIWIKLVPVEETESVKMFAGILKNASVYELQEIVTTSDLEKKSKRSMLYSSTISSNNTEDWHLLLLLLIQPDGAIDPKVFLGDIKTLMTHDMTIRYGNYSTNFSQQFSKLSPYQKDHSSTIAETKPYKVLRIIQSSKFETGSMPVAVTKLFFCEQITLDNTESYVLSKSGDLLFYKPLRTYLYKHEFYLAYSSTGEMQPRICLSDSDYTSTTSGEIKLLLGKVCLGVTIAAVLLQNM